MNHAAGVGVCDSRRKLAEQPGGNQRRQRPGSQPLSETPSLDERHREERLPGCFSDLEDWHDTFVAELRGGDRLGSKSRAVIGRCKTSAEDCLERDFAIEARMPRLIDHAHAAATDLLLDFILADAIAIWRIRYHCGSP